MTTTRNALALLLSLVGCVPTHAAYVAIPMQTLDGEASPRALVVVPLDRLAPCMEPFDPANLAFWGRGREPVPHVLLDRDGDGTPDHAALRVPVATGVDHLIVTCPGPAAPGEPPEVALEAFSEVWLDFGGARR